MTDDSSLPNTVQCESTSLNNVVNQTVHPISMLAENPLLVTVLSAIVFFVVGAWAWSLKFVLLLFPILLFHELGHFTAMKLFGYQNVRIFFIPLLGAAVAGRSESGSIGQRIIVCLAGPMPGITMAIVIWLSGNPETNHVVSAIVVMLLVINGFNLLPILPFDGGWLIHTLLFARHPWLEFILRCTAIVILFATAIASKTWLLALVAIPLIVGLKSGFHFCRIQSRLLSLTPSKDAKEVTLSDQKILTAVRDEFRGAILTETIAKQWLHRIDSTINAPRATMATAIMVCAIVLFTVIAAGTIVLNLTNKPATETENPQQLVYRQAVISILREPASAVTAQKQNQASPEALKTLFAANRNSQILC